MDITQFRSIDSSKRMSHVVGYPSTDSHSVTLTRSETYLSPQTATRSDKDDAKSIEPHSKQYSSTKMNTLTPAIVDSVLTEVASYYQDDNVPVNEQTQEVLEDRQVDVEETEDIVKYSKKPNAHFYSKIKTKVVFQHGNYQAFLKNLRMEEELGSGASCRVLKVRNLLNDKVYAVKQLAASNPVSMLLFTQEIELLQKLNHPNIVTYFDCFIDAKSYYIGTEFCSGGTLLDKIISEGTLLDSRASVYAKDVLSAVEHMHSKQIVHRDLKASNIVLSHDGDDAVVKIIDFGDSEIVHDDKVYTDFVGTVHYMPPEIVRARTGRDLKKSDLWSIGIITYLMVCGRRPFGGKTEMELFKNIVSKPRKLPYPKSLFVSQACRNFIARLICHDIEHRLSASEALQHEWVNNEQRRLSVPIKSGGKPSIRTSHPYKSPLLSYNNADPELPELSKLTELSADETQGIPSVVIQQGLQSLPVLKDTFVVKDSYVLKDTYSYLDAVEETEVLNQNSTTTTITNGAHPVSTPTLSTYAFGDHLHEIHDEHDHEDPESSLMFDHDFDL